MIDRKKYHIDSLCKSLIQRAKLTVSDAIYIRNSFIPNRDSEILVVKGFTGYNSDDDAIIKIAVNRETCKVVSYNVRYDVNTSPFCSGLSKWLDELVNGMALIDVDYTMYMKNHDLQYQPDNITVVTIMDPIVDGELLHYFFNESTKDVFRCDNRYGATYRPPTITYDELEVILAGLANGNKILPKSIKTNHIRNKAIGPEQLAEKYAQYSEVYNARVDNVDGIHHETLKGHLDALGEYISGLRTSNISIVDELKTIKKNVKSIHAEIERLKVGE